MPCVTLVPPAKEEPELPIQDEAALSPWEMYVACLVLYVAVNKEDMPSYVATGLLPRRHVGRRCSIGLRERPEDALNELLFIFMEWNQ